MTASKRIFCLLLCMLMVAFLAVNISAEDTTASLASNGEFSYEILDNGTVGITGYNGAGGDVVIPQEIDSMTVTILGDELFWYNENITSVSLPQSLEYIGNRVFQNCTALEQISIPDSVMEIGDACFYGCSSLREINVPSNLVYVGAFAFDDTAWVTQFDGCSCIILGGRVFYKYLADEDKVVIPDDVVCISDNAFEGKNLSFVSIPDSVAFIGDFCFYSCKNLKEIKLPSDIYLLGEYSLGYSADTENAVKTDGFVIYADENTLGADYAAENEFELKASAQFTEPESMPAEEVCVPTAEIRPAGNNTQKTTVGLSQGSVIAIVLSIGGCVIVIGGIAVISHFHEKKRKKDNKDNQKQNSKKKKK